MKKVFSKVTGSILLVSGTTIGAGMLALPIATGGAGVTHSILLFLGAFLFMLMSVFLLLEVTLWTEEENANLISIVRGQLGKGGEAIAWLSFLMLLYSVAAAYISAGGSLFTSVINETFTSSLSPQSGMIIFALLFGFFVIFETHAVTLVNRFFVFGLMTAFFGLLIFATPKISLSNYESGTTKYLWSAIPVVILSFTSHIIVPSLKTYLNGSIKKLKKTLFIGSLIPLVFYLVWELIILGVLPVQGKYSLFQIAQADHPISSLTQALYELLHNSWIAILVGCFSFFALVTSFFGVALSLYDFLADGFRIRKNFGGRLILLSMIFIPPLFFSIFYPKGFILALGYAGVFVAVLYGILPSIMVWKGRYLKKNHLHASFQTPGGRLVPLIVLTGSIIIIFLQIASTKGYIPKL